MCIRDSLKVATMAAEMADMHAANIVLQGQVAKNQDQIQQMLDVMMKLLK